MAEVIRWLHLSDFHLGCRGAEVLWQVREELAVGLRRDVERLGAPDLVLLTGDLAYSGEAREYELFDRFLDEILEWIREADPGAAEPLVIPVPGNHDVRRPRGTDAFAYRVLDDYGRGRDDPGVARLLDLLWEERDPSFLRPLFENYQAWLERRILPRLRVPGVRVTPSYFPGDLAVELDLPERPSLLVVGLNSTWMEHRGGDFEGRLELDPRQLHAVLERGDDSPLALLERYPRAILLLHQPESWLSERALSGFRGSIYPPGRFAVCLHGHLHEGRSRVLSEAGGGPRCYFQAPSLFGLEHYGTSREERIVGYAWGEISARGEVRVWPRRRIVRGDGAAAFDRDPFFHCGSDGSVVLRAATEKPTTPGPELSPAEPVEPDLEPYAEWAAEQYRTLSLVGVGGGDIRLSLEEVYVPLRLVQVDPTAGRRGGGRSRESTAVIEPEDLFGHLRGPSRPVVVLGDPGAGKTTILLRLHQQCLAGTVCAEGTVPVFLRLRRLRAEDLGQPLGELLERELAETSDRRLEAGLGRRLWQRGRLLLLLDGLDEIASDKLRGRVCRYLEREVDTAADRGVRAVISCRHTGLQGSGLQGGTRLSEDWLFLDVRPLDARQCQRLVELWFREARRVLPDYPEREAREAVERLAGALAGRSYGSQRLKVLVGSPLLLTLLCVVVLRGGEMPKQRVAFYRQCLDMLLGQWARSKRAPREAWEPPLGVETALALLRTLAWKLHDEERQADLSRPELVLHLEERLEELGHDVNAFRVLSWLHRETGVLEEFQGHYGFLHLGVQEYLAALNAVTVGGELLARLCERGGDPWWTEVLLLTAGLSGPRLFAALTRQLLSSPLLLERADLLRSCVDEAPEVDLEPFLEGLEPGADPARRRAILLLVRGRRDPRLRGPLETLARQGDGDLARLAEQVLAEMHRPSGPAGTWDGFLVHHGEDTAAAARLAERLRRDGFRVRTLAEAESEEGLEPHLGSVLRVAVLVGRRAPWEERGPYSVLRLFARRSCELVPVLLAGSPRPVPPPAELGLAPPIELGEGLAGAEAVVGRLPERGASGDLPDALVTSGEPFTERLTGTRFLWIPGGRFRMGGGSYDDERPSHPVRVSPFWLAETPVTNRQYSFFLEATGHDEPPRWRDRRFSAGEQPVAAVSWHDARDFCRWLSQESSIEITLPSEAQWEFAARGPEGREYPWGGEVPDASRACFEARQPSPVGSFPAGRGPFGTLDQAGNVWEWCRDVWDDNAYSKREPELPDPCLEGPDDLPRVLRGGSWNYPADHLRATCRGWFRAAERVVDFGFRLAVVRPTSLRSHPVADGDLALRRERRFPESVRRALLPAERRGSVQDVGARRRLRGPRRHEPRRPVFRPAALREVYFVHSGQRDHGSHPRGRSRRDRRPSTGPLSQTRRRGMASRLQGLPDRSAGGRRAARRSEHSFKEMLEAAVREGVTIYSIGLDLKKGSAGRGSLNKLAAETGERSFFIKDVTELDAIYAEIQGELRSQYLLAYQSSHGREDTGFRTVEVEVRSGGEARTLRGYYP